MTVTNVVCFTDISADFSVLKQQRRDVQDAAIVSASPDRTPSSEGAHGPGSFRRLRRPSLPGVGHLPSHHDRST